MAIGALTTVAEAGLQPSAPVFIERFSFAGDSSYPTGGTAAFQATVRAKLGRNVTIIGVVGQDCGGFSVAYDFANDKLMVFRTDQVDDPQEEVPNTTNLSAVTFHVLVFCQ